MKLIKKGFTLIELLVVIGVLAVLMAGVVALINPVEKTRQANDAKVQNDVSQIITAVQSFSAQQTDGAFPCMTAAAGCPNPTQSMGPGTAAFNAIGPLGSQELTVLPTPPTGSAYYYYAAAGPRPTGFVVWGRYISGKYNTSVCAAGTNGYFVYDSRVGRPGGICLAAAPNAYPAAAQVPTF